MAVEHGLGLVVVDNADDVDRLEATVPAGRAQDVLVRVIPGVTADTHASVLTGHAGSKFGLAPRAAAELIRRIEHSPRLRMQGLHVHVGSQILAVEPFAQSVAPVAALGEFPVYDLGGGLGARYTYADEPPSVGAYLDALTGAAREHLPPDAELIIEPGRSMVASAATTLYRVVDRQARGAHVRRRRRRDGRQPRGGAGRPALRGGDRRPRGRGRRRAGERGGPPLRERRRADRRDRAPRPAGRGPAGRAGHGRVLLHDGQQLQRRPPHPRGVRERRRGPPGRAARDAGRPAGARRRVRPPPAG